MPTWGGSRSRQEQVVAGAVGTVGWCYLKGAGHGSKGASQLTNGPGPI
jgi:hypothetical protein